MKVTLTALGPIAKIGTWTLSLEVSRLVSRRLARAAAYRVAIDVIDAFQREGFDVRVVEGTGEDPNAIAVTVEVVEPKDFRPALEVLARAAGSAAVRSW